MAEDYVRPPLIAVEPRSMRAQTWRFRLLLILALVVLAVGAFLLVRALVGGGEGNPGIGNGQAGRAPAVVVPAAPSS